jgi:GT2 family glycosyltransferase
VTLRYVSEQAPGVTRARNCGAREARNPYLVYIDDDCTVAPDWLNELVSGFDLDSRVMAVGGGISLCFEETRPSWVGPELEQWFAGTTRLGTGARLLDVNEHIVEANMALDRNAWQAAGGFLGMEQFGSHPMAAGEVLYLQEQLYRLGGKIAFVPQAVAFHHLGSCSRTRMLRRAYWQGVSDALLACLLKKPSWISNILQTGLDAAACVLFLTAAAFSWVILKDAAAMYHLVRAVRRMGLVLGRLHIVGDWTRVRDWSSVHDSAPAVWQPQQM